jgi:hypothetical protein
MMELTQGQRRLAFVVTVVVLAGLGAFLLHPGTHASGPRHPAATSAPRAAPSTPSGAAVVATPSVAPAPTGSVDIYRWLPFSPPALAKAAGVTQQFGAYYDTFSYTESASDYVGRMQGLVTSQLSASLARGYATPGVASQRTQQKQVATASTVINSLRAFGASSLTFVVTIKQAMSSTQGKSQTTGQFAITVSGSGANWQVNDIELASAGNS